MCRQDRRKNSQIRSGEHFGGEESADVPENHNEQSHAVRVQVGSSRSLLLQGLGVVFDSRQSYVRLTVPNLVGLPNKQTGEVMSYSGVRLTSARLPITGVWTLNETIGESVQEYWI